MSDRDGVDIASFQGTPGQWKGAAGDIGWAAVKITELQPDGTRYVNPDAEGDLQYLASTGKKRVLYLFAHPGASAAETASFFTGEVRSLGLRDDDMVAADLEVNDGKAPAEVAAWGRDVLSFLEHDLDRIPLLYTFLNFAETGNCEGMGGYPLWIADVNSPPGQPRVPEPWKGWAVHQYSQAQPIDRDICAYRSAAEMARVLGKRHFPVLKPDPGKPQRVPKHRARKAVKKAVVVTKGGVKKEPVLTAASAASLATALLGFLQHHGTVHLDAAQVKVLVTCLVALAGLVSSATVKPARVAGVTTAVTTAATALFSMLVPGAAVTGTVPFAALLTALLVRMHVSPKAPPPAPPAS